MSIFQNFYSVTEFGAAGDGVQNDTTAIRNAIAAAYPPGTTLPFDGSSKARIIFFPVGTYLINDAIEVPPNVILLGEGLFSSGLTGAIIKVGSSSSPTLPYDGVGIRFIRRNRSTYVDYGAAVLLEYSFNNDVGPNQMQNPNSPQRNHAVGVGFSDGGSGACKNNRVFVPGREGTDFGSNTCTVLSDGAGGLTDRQAIPIGNSPAVAQNMLFGSDWFQFHALSSDPTVTAWGAAEKGRMWFLAGASNVMKYFDGTTKKSF